MTTQTYKIKVDKCDIALCELPKGILAHGLNMFIQEWAYKKGISTKGVTLQKTDKHDLKPIETGFNRSFIK